MKNLPVQTEELQLLVQRRTESVGEIDPEFVEPIFRFQFHADQLGILSSFDLKLDAIALG